MLKVEVTELVIGNDRKTVVECSTSKMSGEDKFKKLKQQCIRRLPY